MRLRFLLGLAAVAAIAISSVLGAIVIRANESNAFEHHQRDQALRSAHQAEALATLSVGQLASAAAFYQAEGTFTRHEFDVIADSLLSTGALTATGFVQAVPRSARSDFERGRSFPITHRSGLGALHREGNRAFYYPLAFEATDKPLSVEPPLGFDVGSDPVRASFLLNARDTGKPTATPVIRLPVGGTGINVFRPVYTDGAPTNTVAQRRAALVGFAVGGFHLSDLAAAAATAVPDDVDVQLRERGRRVAGATLPRDDSASAPIRIADRTWLLVVHDPNRPAVLLPALMAALGILLAALLGALVMIWSRNERMQELQRQASQDSLTGLKNRRRFEEDLRTEMVRSRREGADGALLMLDLDNFKRVNDTLGHPTGDRVIAEIAGVLRGRMRETDVLARLGGDEFAIVLPRCTVAEARGVAEAIATAIREHVPPGDGVPAITASIGIAAFGRDPRGDIEALQKAADAAMYAAKDAGRDAVRVATVETGDEPEESPRAGSARPA